MTKQFEEFLSSPNYPNANVGCLSYHINLAKSSQKFLLPDGGRLVDDYEYKALDDSIPLRLPYPKIALEYFKPHEMYDNIQEGESRCSKSIIFACENVELGVIEIHIVCYVDGYKTWVPLPVVWIPTTNYLNRNYKSEEGRVGIKVGSHAEMHHPIKDFMDETGTLLCFLNILQCSNVCVDKSYPNKQPAKHGKKDSLPFDTYHILTMFRPDKNGQYNGAICGNAHRSPREHLRRGHIRRLQDGRKIWVNAAIVNPGVNGIVHKDYIL